MDFRYTEEQLALQETLQRFIARDYGFEQRRALAKAEPGFSTAAWTQYAELGLLALPFPEEYGGAGGSLLDMTIVAEEIARVSADLVMAYTGNIFCGLNLVRKASEEQKRYWLPRLIKGEIKFSISMSEPDAGSDIGAMRTTAARDGNQWVINGQKIWASMAGAKNNVISLYVKTDPKTHYRQGMSLFLVDNDTPGLTLRKLDMLGRRATGTYELIFDNVRVPPDRLVGGENKGWDVVMSGLQVERAASCAGNVGAAQGIVDLALQYAKDRKQFGRPIGTNQSIAHMLADMQTEVEAARTLMWRAAWLVSTGQDALREITMAKLFTSEVYVKIANQGMQVLGGFGYCEEFDMSRLYRDARAATIAAGTSQIQRNLIANLMGLKVQ